MCISTFFFHVLVAAAASSPAVAAASPVAPLGSVLLRFFVFPEGVVDIVVDTAVVLDIVVVGVVVVSSFQ